MNPMNPIRRRLAASSLANPKSIWQAIWRGGALGLSWGHLFGAIVVGVMLTALVAVIAYAVAYFGIYRGMSLDYSKLKFLLRPFGAVIGLYVVICGYGIVLGAIAGAVIDGVRHRR